MFFFRFRMEAEMIKLQEDKNEAEHIRSKAKGKPCLTAYQKTSIFIGSNTQNQKTPLSVQIKILLADMIQLTGMIVNILCQKLLKNRAPVLRRRDHTRYSDMKLKSG